MLKKMSFIFGSKTKAQEILFLLHGVKEVVRQGFYQRELLAVEKFCQENNLYCIKSNFKVLFADEEKYSNKGFRIPETDSRVGMYFVYISKDEQKAWLAAYYELMNNDKDLGLLLGYPSCCVDFFCRNFNEQKVNLQLPPKNPFTNLTKREQDLVLISHFPCSSDCPKSIELAKQHLQVIYAVDKDRARELTETLTVKNFYLSF
ncbi:MAG: DUF483 domain-containing protein [Nanoarchaeota archaeon]